MVLWKLVFFFEYCWLNKNQIKKKHFFNETIHVRYTFVNLKISKSSLLYRILGYFHETQTNFLMVPKTILNQLWQLRIICTRNTNWPTSKLLKSKKICDIIQQLSNTISCVLRGACKCMKKTAINNNKLKNLDVQGL